MYFDSRQTLFPSPWWGTRSISITKIQPYQVTRQAIDAGIFVVAAAGNDGGAGDDGFVSAPGNVNFIITVGASDRNGCMESVLDGRILGFRWQRSVYPHQNLN